MAIQGFCPPSPSPSPPSHSHSPYYQLLEHGSARLGRVKKFFFIYDNLLLDGFHPMKKYCMVAQEVYPVFHNQQVVLPNL